MDLDSAKENIQPLASGRDIHRLEIALNAETQFELHEELKRQRLEYEKSIHHYDGDDPLELWYEYVSWLEQSYPKSGKECALDDVIAECLRIFENDERYRQDRRMIKLYIKFIDAQPNPAEYYQVLYNQGVGTMIADLYICWAHYYDVVDNFEKTESVFRKGIDARAQPLDQLKLAHQQFGFSMSQRILHKDDLTRMEFQSNMEERRFALTSLHAYKNKYVGSARTGSVVKSYEPGRVHQKPTNTNNNRSKLTNSNRNNIENVPIFNDGSNDNVQNNDEAGAGAGASSSSSSTVPPQTSIVQTILDSAKKQENLREPGPWTKANKTNNTKSNSLYGNGSTGAQMKLPFSIMEDPALIVIKDSEDMHRKGIQLPVNFIRRNEPLNEWHVNVCLDDNIEAKRIPVYDKFMLYPTATENICFSPEELRGYNWFRKRNIENELTKRCRRYFENSPSNGIRLFPQFSKINEPNNHGQDDDSATKPIVRYEENEMITAGKAKLCLRWMNEIYPSDSQEEFSIEEVLRKKWLSGTFAQNPDKTIMMNEDLDETTMVTGRQSIAFGAYRKSIVPGGRKSIMPAPATAISNTGNYDDNDNKPRITITNNRISMFPINESNELVDGDDDDDESTLVNENSIGKKSGATGAIPKIKSNNNNNNELHSSSTQSPPPQPSPPQLKSTSPPPPPPPPPINKKHLELIETKKVYIDENSENVFYPKPSQPPPITATTTATKTIGFSIFQDDDDNNLENHFKTPKVITSLKSNKPAVLQPILQIQRSPESNDEPECEPEPAQFSPIANEEKIVNKDDDNNNNNNNIYQNETCSTQMFNLFIREQSVSTPISSNPKTQSRINHNGMLDQQQYPAATATVSSSPLSTLSTPTSLSRMPNDFLRPMEPPHNDRNRAQQIYMNFNTMSPNSSPLPDEYHQQQQQLQQQQQQQGYNNSERKTMAGALLAGKLSTIMETTETMSSGTASTKSTVGSPDLKKINETSPSSSSSTSSCGTSCATASTTAATTTTTPNTMILNHQQSDYQTNTSSSVLSRRTSRENEINKLEDLKEIPKQQVTQEHNPSQNPRIQSTNTNIPFNIYEDSTRIESNNSPIIIKTTEQNKQKPQPSNYKSNFIFNTNHPPIDNNNTMPSLHSIQIYEDKTEKILNELLVQNLQTKFNDDEMLNMFTKTPIKSTPFQYKFQSKMKDAKQPPPPPTPPPLKSKSPSPLHLNLHEKDKKMEQHSSLIIDENPLKKQNYQLSNKSLPLINTSTSAASAAATVPANSSLINNSNIKSRIPIRKSNNNISQQRLNLSGLSTSLSSLLEEPSSIAIGCKSTIKTINATINNNNNDVTVAAATTAIDDGCSILLEQTKINNNNNSILPQLELTGKYFQLNVNDIDDLNTIQLTNPILINNNHYDNNNTNNNNNSTNKIIYQDKSSMHIKDELPTINLTTSPYSINTVNMKLEKLSISNGNGNDQKSIIRSSSPPLTPPSSTTKKMIFSSSFSLTEAEQMHLFEKSTLIMDKDEDQPFSDDQKFKNQTEVDDNEENTNNNNNNNNNNDDVVAKITELNENDNEIMHRSIYIKKPIEYVPEKFANWNELQTNQNNQKHENDNHETNDNENNKYLFNEVNMNQTLQLIEDHIKDDNNENGNPFDVNVRAAFLDKIYFIDYISTLDDLCILVNKVMPLRPTETIRFGNRQLEILKLIGEGSYGHVFLGKTKKSKDLYALKLERPANKWEYYICLEIETRIENPNILTGFMTVKFAMIGNNASILAYDYSSYGSLLNVCHQVKLKTGRNIDEYIVMLLTIQMLTIIDHLHAIHIIHADIKPDNFLLMKKLEYDQYDKLSIQLIDFGQAIDLQLYSNTQQTFSYKVQTSNFICTEMLENKRWSYQHDLFCLASTIHAMLFGNYMEVQKCTSAAETTTTTDNRQIKISSTQTQTSTSNLSSIVVSPFNSQKSLYFIKTKIPRYFNKTLWENILHSLINVNPMAMPNLQDLRTQLKEEITANEKCVKSKLMQFNQIFNY